MFIFVHIVQKFAIWGMEKSDDKVSFGEKVMKICGIEK